MERLNNLLIESAAGAAGYLGQGFRLAQRAAIWTVTLHGSKRIGHGDDRARSGNL